MYSPEIQTLISRAQELGIERKPTVNNPRAISIKGNRDEFPERLWALAEALDKIGDTPDRNFLALDCVMEWLKIQGIDTQDIFVMLDMIAGKKDRRFNKRLSRLVEERKTNFRLLGGAAPSTPVIRGM